METVQQAPATPGFVSHMFELGNEDKGQLLNYMQYVLVAMIPVVIVLKLIRAYVPEEDEDKGSAMIAAETVGQILAIFLSIWLIDRFVRFIPTYSKQAYQPMYLTNFVTAFLMILLTMQSKLGAKVDILVDKVSSLWNGESSLKDEDKGKKHDSKDKKKKNVSFADKSRAQSAPHADGLAILRDAAPQGQMPSMPTRQSPDFNAMYQNDATPLQDASTPGMGGFEPVAANQGSFGGSFY